LHPLRPGRCNSWSSFSFHGLLVSFSIGLVAGTLLADVKHVQHAHATCTCHMHMTCTCAYMCMYVCNVLVRVFPSAQMTLQAIPVIQGKNYSHLATNEMVCDSSCDDSFGIVQVKQARHLIMLDERHHFVQKCLTKYTISFENCSVQLARCRISSSPQSPDSHISQRNKHKRRLLARHHIRPHHNLHGWRSGILRVCSSHTWCWKLRVLRRCGADVRQAAVCSQVKKSMV
jgi:hypothetical protein